MVIYRLGLPYYKEFDNFQFIKNSNCLTLRTASGSCCITCYSKFSHFHVSCQQISGLPSVKVSGSQT